MGAAWRRQDRQRGIAWPALTLGSQGVPERQALEIVLRGVSGYVRGTAVRWPGASMYDRIMILPTSVAPPIRRLRPRWRRRQASSGPSLRDEPRTSQRRSGRGAGRTMAFRWDRPVPLPRPVVARPGPGSSSRSTRQYRDNEPPPKPPTVVGHSFQSVRPAPAPGPTGLTAPPRQRPAAAFRSRLTSTCPGTFDRFKPDDRRGVDTLYRRTHGADAANALRLRWDWQHRRNPYNQSGQPEIWVAREGPTIVGHYTTLPVRVSIKGIEVEGAWGSDAMVAPERRRQGIGEALVRTWDRNSGAVLSLGATTEGRRAARPSALARRRTSSRVW